MAQHTQAVIEDNDRRLSHRVPKEPLARSVRRQIALTLALSPENIAQDQLDSESERPKPGDSGRTRNLLMT